MDALANIDPISINTIIAVVAVTVLDFVTGALRAVADKTFTLAAVDVWVRTQILGRVIPIVLLILAGQFIGSITVGDPDNGGISLSLLGITGMGAALTVIAAGLKSILDNVRPSVEHPVPVE